MPMVARMSFGEKVTTALIYIALGIFALISLFPFIHVVARSFSAEFPILRGEVTIWPVNFTVEAYKRAFELRSLLISFGNTVFLATVGTAIQMFMSICVAYPLSRKRLPLRTFFIVFVVFTILFPVGIIPFYVLIRSLGLLNTLWALIIPYGITSFNMIIIKNYFQSIPDSLEEAALIDGASEITILVKIYLPLSAPVLATITLFYMVQNWNVFLPAVFFINRAELWPIQVTLRGLLFEDLITTLLASEDFSKRVGIEGLKAATVVISILPILAVYPFIQKYFVKGIMLGSIKG